MIQVCALTDLPAGESTRVVAHVPVAVFNADGELFAIDDTCTHQDASLSEGWLEDCMIECPLHAASFDLRTGKPTGPPAKRPVRTYPVLVQDGVVYVDAPARASTAARGGPSRTTVGPRDPAGCGVTRRTIAVDRRLAVRAAGRAAAARPGLRRRPRHGRRGAAPALRPSAAVQGVPARHRSGPPTWRSPSSRTSTSSTRGGTWVSRPSGSTSPVAGSVLASGEEIAADGVVIATGGVPRRLPAADGLLGVHVLRSLEDADALRAELTGGAEHVVVIGAGFIGAEVAATCRALGLDVTIVEAMPVPLSVALGPELGAVCAGLHATNGVPLLTGTTVVDWLTADDGAGRRRVTALELSDGRRLRADVVVVGIGMAAGGRMAGRLRALPRQRRPHRRRLRHRPPEHRRRRRRRPTVQPAHRPQRPPGALDGRGRGPGRSRCGTCSPGAPCSTSTSRATSGPTSTAPASSSPAAAEPSDEVRFLDGAPADGAFVATYHRGEATTAVLAMNSPRQFTRLRRQLAAAS